MPGALAPSGHSVADLFPFGSAETSNRTTGKNTYPQGNKQQLCQSFTSKWLRVKVVVPKVSLPGSWEGASAALAQAPLQCISLKQTRGLMEALLPFFFSAPRNFPSIG